MPSLWKLPSASCTFSGRRIEETYSVDSIELVSEMIMERVHMLCHPRPISYRSLDSGEHILVPSLFFALG